jgi:TonB family protein
MSEDALDLAPTRQRDFRRMVALSAAAHVALSVGAVVSLPGLGSREAPMGDPSITLITPQELAAMTGAPAPPAKPKPPAPEPAAAPVAQPEPPPPPQDQIIISEDLNQRPSKPKPKPEPPVEREIETRPQPAEQPEQVDLEDLLIEERILSGAMPGQAKPDAKPRALPGSGGTGPAVSPEVAAWQARVRAHVRRNWALTPGLRSKGLRALVQVELTASGLVLDYQIERSSGNPWFDDSVERFLEEAGSLPPPPESGDWPIEFTGDF